MSFFLTNQAIDPDEQLRAFRGIHADAGALASFIGLCRSYARGGPVLALELEVYPGFTERVIADRLRALEATPGVDGLMVIHRFGRVGPGEAIVLVAAAGPHRRAVISLVDETMDWLKVEAPFWKREHSAEGARWIEPTDQDRADLARWAEVPLPAATVRPAGSTVQRETRHERQHR